MKQTKMVKFVFCVLFLVPIVLFVTGVVQTFVIKSEKSKLENVQTQLAEAKQEYEEKSEIYRYMDSDQYLEDYYKHNGYDGEEYGEDGDINIVVK